MRTLASFLCLAVAALCLYAALCFATGLWPVNDLDAMQHEQAFAVCLTSFLSAVYCLFSGLLAGAAVRKAKGA